MPHFRVDDALHSHPKARQAGLEAMGLWNLCGSYCMGYLTDGFVPEWYVKTWPKGAALAKRLVAAGLWSTAVREGEKGWQFHEFTGPGRNDSRAQVEESRKKWRDRKAGQRADSPPVSPEDTLWESPVDSPQESPVESLRATRDPTQPNPTNNGGHLGERSSPNVGVERGLSDAIAPTASRLVATVIPDQIPATVRTALRIQASQLMNADGLDADIVADALRRWLAKPDAGAGLLPSLAADAVKARAGAAKPPHKMRALSALEQKVRAEEQAQLVTSRTELE